MPATPREEPRLPCPECAQRHPDGYGGRIGNHRNRCTLCNNFVHNVERITRRELVARHAEDFRAIRLRVEFDLYPQVIEEWSAKNLRGLE